MFNFKKVLSFVILSVIILNSTPIYVEAESAEVISESNLSEELSEEEHSDENIKDIEEGVLPDEDSDMGSINSEESNESEETESTENNESKKDVETKKEVDLDTESSEKTEVEEISPSSSESISELDSVSRPVSNEERLSARSLTDYTIAGLNPPGTVINLFDYWQSSENTKDDTNASNWQNIGINNGHVLKFGTGMGNSNVTSYVNTTNVNHWTKSENVRYGIVKNNLVNGYPVLSDSLGGESLDYLFNPDVSSDGKRSYENAGGLLQANEEGYYYYNSTQNFAEYDSNSGDFILYNSWAVRPGGSSPNGQFFPFNAGSDVFYDYGSWISPSYVTSTNSIINHYFGLTMSTRFVQVNGGHVKQGGSPITYNFSGDDDIWIFIDDVLVADLGGVHDMSSMSIDFSDGSIVINKGTQYEKQTNLRKQFELAGASTSEFAEGTNTFADDTYHTLKFFYLERGNTDSNMSLSFNLVTIPESSLIKVDQVGTPLEGVKFNLYSTDENYENKVPVTTGTTESDGSFVFQDSSGSVIHLSELYEQYVKDDGIAYFALEEVNPPKGYRSTGDVQFRLEKHDEYVIPLSSNQWNSGAYAMANANISTGSLIWMEDGWSVDLDETDGILFASIIMLDEDGKQSGVVYGNVKDGFHVANGSDIGTVTDTISQYSDARYTFAVDSSGSYKCIIYELPGDLTSYGLLNNSNPKYTVKYFFSTASNPNDINRWNTYNVDDSEFIREFSANIYVPNIKNHLLVQKVDENGKTLDGATFSLYNESDVVDGKVVSGATPVDTLVTMTGEYTEGTASFMLSGGGVFPSKNNVLASGNYYLVEDNAPVGFDKSESIIPITVDSSGVYADALDKDDDVVVKLGVGSLVSSMVQFANTSLYSPILSEIEVGLVDGKDVNVDWSNPLRLSYEADNAYLSYGSVDGGNLLYTVDTGIKSISVRPKSSNMNISNLFSGTVTVQVANNTSLVDVSVEKLWKDDNNSDGNRANFVKVDLYQNGTKIGDTLTLNEENNWKSSWTNLREYDDSGNKYKYTVSEVSSIQGYNTSITNKGYDFTITNSKSPSLSLSKKVTGLFRNPGEKFEFSITLYSSNGEPITDSYKISGSIDGTINFYKGNADVYLEDLDSITITGLPEGAVWEIKENGAENYDTTWNVEGEEKSTYSVSGQLQNSNINVTAYNRLIDIPDTGLESNTFTSEIVLVLLFIVVSCSIYIIIRKKFIHNGK